VRFTKLVPVIHVEDLNAEVQFYKDLGFSILDEGDEFSGFVAMRQGDVEFGIEISERFRARAANDTVLWQFRVDDLAAVARLCVKFGYRYTTPAQFGEPMDGWAMNVFSPNGYRVNLEGVSARRRALAPALSLDPEPEGRTPDFSRGLITAVVQDAGTAEVLMVAHMNQAAYEATMVTRRATFWSRSRERLWQKGETSGNSMHIIQVRVDCDGDAVLLLVEPAGPACHTGARSCFIAPPPGLGDTLAAHIGESLAPDLGASFAPDLGASFAPSEDPD
jgi:phosphoribosyl-AMP cyclohydrolase